MKRIYLIVPLVAIAAFAGFDQMWRKQKLAMTHSETSAYAGRDGRQEALADLARGKLGMVSYGKLVHWMPEYREILSRDHGIEYRAIAGCIVSDSILKYAAAYNEVMEPQILTRYGPKVFDEAAASAQALYAERHQARQ